MKINLDKIELNSRINALNLTTHFSSEKHKCELYYDTELNLFFVIREKEEGDGNKYSGKIMVPAHNVAAAQISEISVPKHQPIGTPDSHDTPSGNRKPRTEATFKKAIAEKIAERTASKTE
jgi:hypothetical protein